MFDHAERAPRNGLDAFTRTVIAWLVMTLIAVMWAAGIAAVLLVTTEPVAVVVAAVAAAMLVALVAKFVANRVRP